MVVQDFNYKGFTVANNNMLVITSNADQFVVLCKGCGCLSVRTDSGKI